MTIDILGEIGYLGCTLILVVGLILSLIGLRCRKNIFFDFLAVLGIVVTLMAVVAFYFIHSGYTVGMLIILIGVAITYGWWRDIVYVTLVLGMLMIWAGVCFLVFVSPLKVEGYWVPLLFGVCALGALFLGLFLHDCKRTRGALRHEADPQNY